MTAPAGKGDAAGQDARTPRCIVWLAPDGKRPRPLLAGLERRDVRTVLAETAPDVMRHLAIAPTLALITVEPARQPHLRELHQAVAHYYPGTRLWQYRRRSTDGTPALEPMERDVIVAAPRTPAPAAADDVVDEQRLAPAAMHEQPPDDAPAEDETTRPHLASLTSEELAMLLGDDDQSSSWNG
ncbi:MAG: hypothetical protein ACODAQ_09955 [Phycisphaeraceae bacterium]